MTLRAVPVVRGGGVTFSGNYNPETYGPWVRGRISAVSLTRDEVRDSYEFNVTGTKYTNSDVVGAGPEIKGTYRGPVVGRYTDDARAFEKVWRLVTGRVVITVPDIATTIDAKFQARFTGIPLINSVVEGPVHYVTRRNAGRDTPHSFTMGGGYSTDTHSVSMRGIFYGNDTPASIYGDIDAGHKINGSAFEGYFGAHK